MKHQLSQDQIDRYRDQGFLAIPGFLDAGELANWRTCTGEAVAIRLGKAAPDGKGELLKTLNNQDDAESYYAAVFTQCLQLWQVHDGMKKIMHDPRLGEVATRLSGADGMRIWHDQALIKPPYGNPTGWHLDVPYWSFSRRDAISIWVALEDATPANGCMYYIPGSHKTARYDNSGIGQNLSALFKLYPEWRAIDPVGVPAAAGTAVFHNGLTAHGAGANMTNKPRPAMTCGYMPDGSTFNGTQNILPDDVFKKLKIGDLLNDDARNPLIWHK
jgi:phytanoyl-CoA hydroxylase